MKATVFQITRTSLHDGDGVRTVVYLKGCTMECRWCHNPEGLLPKPEILHYPQRCIGCGRCVSLCPECHEVTTSGMRFLREWCTGCGRCAEACPNEVLILSGREMTVEEVFAEIVKDKPYYDRTGGGVTLSGGECLLWPAFCRALLERCRGAGISTAVETALHVPWENIAAALPVTGTFLADLKHGDEAEHSAYTGGSLSLILDNLERLTALHSDVRLRIPLIHGINDGEALVGIGRRIRALPTKPKSVELLRFNAAGLGKYWALDADTSRVPVGNPQTDAEMEAAANILRQQLTDTPIFFL
ncbi:MAG: glycyl-radical enzyme activating protein [Oscillospiraceae bacterium]